MDDFLSFCEAEASFSMNGQKRLKSLMRCYVTYKIVESCLPAHIQDIDISTKDRGMKGREKPVDLYRQQSNMVGSPTPVDGRASVSRYPLTHCVPPTPDCLGHSRMKFLLVDGELL